MKLLRVIALLIVVLAAFAAGALWMATRPSATPPAAGVSPPADGAPGGTNGENAGSPDALLSQLRRDGSIRLGADDLEALTRAVLADSVDGREFLRVSRDFTATIDADYVEIGGTFDLAALDETALSEDARSAVEQMRSTVPFLLNSERYLGVRGMPRAIGGNIGFGADATLRVGSLGLPVGLLTFLGSEDEIANASLTLPELYVTDIIVSDEQLTVAARPEQR